MVGELVDVALDMAGRQTAGAVGEQGVDGVPRQQGTVVAAGNGRLVLALGEHAGHAGDDPRRGLEEGDAVLGILEVVDVGGIVLRTTGGTCYEVGKLARKGNLRGLRTVEQRQPVEHVGEPLALRLPVDVQSPQRILEGFGTHGDLGRQRLFGEVLQGTANLEVLGEVVLPVEAEHALALQAIVVVGLQRDIDVGTRIDDALVEDGDFASGVVDGIVAALRKTYATSRHNDRTLRHIGGTQRDDVSRRALELTHQQELVLVSHLQGCRTGGIVKFVEGILGSSLSVDTLAHQEVLQRSAKGFY